MKVTSMLLMVSSKRDFLHGAFHCMERRMRISSVLQETRTDMTRAYKATDLTCCCAGGAQSTTNSTDTVFARLNIG